jgi:hypothetical protein
MKPIKWQYNGDANMLDYGGTNSRCIGARKFQFVELINMDDACGRDNEGQPKYVVELRLVALNELSPDNIQSALKCCGQEHIENPSDEVIAECCNSYGCHAPLDSWSGGNARKLLRAAYKLANELRDEDKLNDRLDNRPVNKIGSTAREFMTGDITSAMQRGVESGDPSARIMAKMYGVPQDTIDNVRPADWLPYVFGYMAALNGGTKATDPDTSPEYFRGFERGLNVKAGKAPAPAWIQQQPA